MAYISEWERLLDAMVRVMAAARVSKNEAQADICRAIADGAIKFRGKLRRHTTKSLRASNAVLEGKDFQIPTEIKSADLNWEMSHPEKPWIVRRGIFEPSGYWDLEWIELFRTDVTNVLCTAEKRCDSTQHTSRETGATRRSRPARERAGIAIKALYPDGVPGQSIEPNWKLCRQVSDKLKKSGLEKVFDDTILRAAGRRK